MGGENVKDIKLYSTGCPRCRVLKKKLDEKEICYQVITDVDEIMQAGFYAVPVLVVDGTPLDFAAAVKWVAGV